MGPVVIVCISLAAGGVVGFLAGRRPSADPAPGLAGADAIVDLLRLVNEHLPHEAEAVVSLARIMYPTISDYVLAQLIEHPTRPD